MQEKVTLLLEKIEHAQLVLVGIGEAFASGKSLAYVEAAYHNLANMLEGKNYFVITTCTDRKIESAGLKKERVVCPLLEENDQEKETVWEIYLKWLQGTIYKKLLVLELGVGLVYPNLIRFPFEKTVFYNQKAELVRVHDKLFQLPVELKGRGISVEEDAVRLLAFVEN